MSLPHPCKESYSRPLEKCYRIAGTIPLPLLPHFCVKPLMRGRKAGFSDLFLYLCFSVCGLTQTTAREA
jgi:hypothetical protein